MVFPVIMLHSAKGEMNLQSPVLDTLVRRSWLSFRGLSERTKQSCEMYVWSLGVGFFLWPLSKVKSGHLHVWLRCPPRHVVPFLIMVLVSCSKLPFVVKGPACHSSYGMNGRRWHHSFVSIAAYCICQVRAIHKNTHPCLFLNAISSHSGLSALVLDAWIQQ